jgi:type IV fimbrial biogenesis protein FimT
MTEGNGSHLYFFKYMNNNKAFTLLEVIIVLAVIALLGVIAWPNFKDFMAQRRLNGAAREVQGSLMAARMQAVSENRRIVQKIDNGSQYTLFRDSNNNGTMEAGEWIITKDLHPAYHDVSFSASSGDIIIFYPNGTANSGTINLTSNFAESTGSKRITISMSGRVKIN